MNKIRVSAVSYTNSRPFVYGLQHSEIINQIVLTLDNPSDCASKLINNETDIGLIPVAALTQIPNYQIIGDYCIGADGPVNSVFIFSNKPVSEIRTLKLDPQSRTSNALAQVLLSQYWKVNVVITTDNNPDAFVEIGDRTFGKTNKYPYVYDLAGEWKNFSGLPFVFALWAANKPIPAKFVTAFNSALKFGLNNIPQVVAGLPQIDNFDLTDYLTKKLDYDLSADKMKALELFTRLRSQPTVVL